MDYEKVAVGIHLVGFALGVGGATVSDILFFQALRAKLISQERFSSLQTISKIVWTGLSILIASGALLFWLIYNEMHALPLIHSPRWQAKLTLVAIVFLNGLFFKFAIIPSLKALVGQTLSLANVGPSIWKLCVAGTLSIVSWYSILILSLLPRTVRPPYWEFMGIYLILIVLGIIVSKTLVTKILKSN